MDFTDLKDYVNLSKEALDLLKSAYSMLPKGEQRDKAEKTLKQATDLLARSDAQLAKDLGYKLCLCAFPPHPMLWRQGEGVFACPRPECGHTIAGKHETKIVRGSALSDARRGYGRK
jgi:hypothetical protein